MKTRVLFYWVATLIIGLETLAGGATDLMRGRAVLVSGPFVLDIVTHLGYPAYLLVILGIFKLLGGVVLLAPGLPRLKEWAYAGVFFELSAAAASWALHGDSWSEWVGPISLLTVSMISWAFRPPSRVLGTIFTPRATA